jgi:broad specificity phosphatase PhoE
MLAPLLGALLAAGPADLGPVPVGALRLYVVRHGQAFSNLQPRPELPAEQLDRLTELGRTQSRAAAAALQGRGVALIVSSPMGRARQTAEELRSLLDVKMRVDERLRPLEMGKDVSGKALVWADRMRDWSAGRDPAHTSAVVLVSHGELIGNLVGMLDAQTLEGRFAPPIANGSITAIEAGPASLPRLLFSNFVAEPQKAAEANRAGAARPAARRLATP